MFIAPKMYNERRKLFKTKNLHLYDSSSLPLKDKTRQNSKNTWGNSRDQLNLHLFMYISILKHLFVLIFFSLLAKSHLLVYIKIKIVLFCFFCNFRSHFLRRSNIEVKDLFQITLVSSILVKTLGTRLCETLFRLRKWRFFINQQNSNQILKKRKSIRTSCNLWIVFRRNFAI